MFRSATCFGLKVSLAIGISAKFHISATLPENPGASGVRQGSQMGLAELYTDTLNKPPMCALGYCHYCATSRPQS